MSRLSVGSLFSGIGGLDLGLERAGMEVRWQVEIDPYCQRVLAKHWPNVTRYGDIKTIDWTEVEPIDLVCGGFPCQPVSLAGKRRAQDDPRWLWPEFARCLRVLRPRFALLENVPGLLSAGFGDVLGDLAALGYDAEWDCIPAAAVGAPHLRYRVVVVSYTNSQRAGVEAHRGGGQVRKRAGSSEPAVLRQEHGTLGAEGTNAGSQNVAHAASIGLEGTKQCVPRLCIGTWFSSSGAEMADSNDEGLEGRVFYRSSTDQWPVRKGCLPNTREWESEPSVGRVASRVPPKLDGGGIDEQVGRAESSAEGIRGRGVPGMWLDSSGAEASSRPERPTTSRDPLRAMSCQGRSAGRDAAHQADADMRGVRPGVPAQVFPSAQDLWAGMSERTWPALGDEEMARFWASEPEGVPRVATGVPNRVDRLRGLGNAVVPQVAEWIGRRIMEVAS